MELNVSSNPDFGLNVTEDVTVKLNDKGDSLTVVTGAGVTVHVTSGIVSESNQPTRPLEVTRIRLGDVTFACIEGEDGDRIRVTWKNATIYESALREATPVTEPVALPPVPMVVRDGRTFIDITDLLGRVAIQ